MLVEVLGSGCPKCLELERRVKQVVKKNKIKAEVTHVRDINKIIERNVFSTPALAISGKIVFSGKIPSIEEIEKLLK